ncbi:S-adenosyl-L-methionine-dependent methyltransferase [Amniculicola lignicola CBS 123094]|uniref:S-adenosyl-L-methionine-dependent methyltransferase n=1 Tax=Amniculicola lignicola CBS 123094 TaxID=1392246 RepID=A0A6A5W2X0_9PLEO|nr:S-adenosyl-L-methionine-dependent methyltransferase [Amniculicola lignicola CBS 123094]
MSQTEEIETLIAQLEHFANAPPEDIDDHTRRNLREASKNLSIAVEMHGDTVHRIGNSALQLYMARVGYDSNLWKVLAESESALSIAQIGEKICFDPTLLKRVLRYYQSLRMLEQPEDDVYVANNVTKALAGADGIAAEYFTTVLHAPFEAIPRYLKSHNYQNPTNPIDSPWQEGYQTKDHPFLWLQRHPDHFNLFMQWMRLNRSGLPSWLDTFPLAQIIGQNTNNDTVLFVDVGSGLGHQSVEVRERFPDLPGRVIIQDTPQVIGTVEPSHKIEPQVYDFFKPQPIHGARAYYLRMILHDWVDGPAIEILKNQISAMSEESVILIDEIVLPKKGASWRATQMDMTMLAAVAAMERSENQWYGLLNEAGLEIVKIWKYTEECDDCIIVAKPTNLV